METAMMLAKIMGPVYLLVGLSVLFYAKTWQNLMDSWKKDHFQLFSLMFVYAVLGLIVVQMYNVWEWNVWLLVTITGWAMLAKSVMYFLLPGKLLKDMMSMKKSEGMMYFGGVIAVAMGAALSYYSYYA